MEETFASRPKKRKILSSSQKCCFCKRCVKEDDNLIQFDCNKGENLLSVCKERQDETSKFIIEEASSIGDGKSNLYYHKGCRAKFMHPHYCKSDTDINTDSEKYAHNQFTRSKVEEFDWKQQCFICGKLCHLKKRTSWSEVKSAVDKNSNLYSQVIRAAELRNDREVLARMLSTNGDLFATDARYHRQPGCLSAYISERNLSFVKSTPEKVSYRTVFESLKDEFRVAIIDQKRVYELCTLKTRFTEIAEEKEISIIDNFKSKSFKQLLSRAWPNLRFISRSGLTDLVCSDQLSADEAIIRAIRIEKQVCEIQDFNNEFVSDKSDSCDDTSVLHKAAVILRNRVLNTTKNMPDKEYYSAGEISQTSQKESLDPMLLQFVNWLSSQKKVDSGDDIGDVEQKVVAVASDITALIAPRCITPKHLGLSVHLHHTFGSKKLIEELSALGHTLSYTEVRHFLTSAALHMSSSQSRTPSGGLIPANINLHEEYSTLVLGAADNWDHNECTLSGKKSTHAMTSILVVPKVQISDASTRIPRVQERSVNILSLPGRGLSHVLPYMKPSERPQPVLASPVRSDELKCPEPASYRLMRLKELMYNIGRCSTFCDDRAMPVPPWTVFHSNIQSDHLKNLSDVTFNPIVMATPTDFSTVYTTLKRMKEQMNAFGQTICPVIFDMGLLSKALEVVWANKTELEGVIAIEGGMHYLMSCFAGIGFLYGDMGLKELLYESDVFARATAEHILSGKDFDRALRAVLMIDEVFSKRFLIQFQLWLNRNGKMIPSKLLDNVSQCANDSGQSLLDSESVGIVLEELNNIVMPLIEQFRTEGRDVSPLFQFWDDFLNNVSGPIKVFLASSRHGDWDSYQFSKLTLLPFFFAANRSVYARYMTYMHLHMNRLPEKALDSFRNGNFVAKLTDGVFNSVWIDYVLEVTENKALKSSGGIIGLTHNDSALTRWFMSRPVTAKYSMGFRNSPSELNTDKKHHTDTRFYKEMFNVDVSKMNDLFVDTFIDPFSLTDAPSQLVNFATGVAVSEESERSLLNCHKDGRAMLQKFIDERFVVEDGNSRPAKSFFDPLPKNKVKPLKGKKSSAKCKSNICISGEEMYLRLFAINSFKKVPLDRVMAFENAPNPLSMFTDEGVMLSNKKSDFMNKIESLVDTALIVKQVDGVDCIVFDGMAVVQMILPVASPIKPTYSSMAALFWKYIIKVSQDIQVVHVVFDSYRENSLKAQTREKRGELATTVSPSHIQAHMKVNDWKRVLTSSVSKRQLTHFYTKFICEEAHEIGLGSKCVFVSGGFEEKALLVKQDSISYIFDLYSDQEQADTRMLLHVQYCGSKGANKVVVFSPDTDVMVLLIHHYFNLGVQQLFFKTGRRSTYSDYTRFIPVHDVVESLSYEQRNILLSVYCITGCDTCSSLFGIGKKKAFKVLLSNAKDLQNMALLGDSESLPANARRDCLTFVGLLYGVNHCVSLNKVRVEKVLNNKATKPKKLPPTDDSFLLHLLRCTYQLFVWKGCLSAIQRLPSPLDFGYEVDSVTGMLRPQLMSQSAAPPELLSDLVCACVDMCSEDCICSSNEQPCTQACECRACFDSVDSEVCKNVFTILASLEVDDPSIAINSD